MSVSKRELFKVWRSETTSSTKTSAVTNHVFNKMGLVNNESEELCQKIKQILQSFTSKPNDRWTKANRCLKNLNVKIKSGWLHKLIYLPVK